MRVFLKEYLKACRHLFSTLFCVFSFHRYKYSEEEYNGTSDWGRQKHKIKMNTRICSHCKNREIQTRWGWESF